MEYLIYWQSYFTAVYLPSECIAVKGTRMGDIPSSFSGGDVAPFCVASGETKVCSSCLQEKPLSEFYRSKANKGGLATLCKVCDKNNAALRYKVRCKRYSGALVATKECSQCGKILDASKFYPNKQRKDGLSTQCKTCNSQNCETYRTNNADSYKTRQRDTYKARRLETLNAYGHKCVCCGETRYQFLAIDHTNGGGREQLRQDGIQRSDLTRWLRDNDYPQNDFRCLCHSCNTSLGMYGYCPHGGVEPTATVLYLPIKGTIAAKRRFNYKQRLLVIASYGGKCSCCGENRFEFMALDHIDGGGTKHRELIGPSVVDYLYRNSFPEGFQVLCHSCNLSRGYYGYCHNEPEVSTA